MKKNRIEIRLFYAFLLVNLLFWNSAGSVQALFGSGSSVPSVEEVMDKVENQYGFDADILRKSQKKGNYPQAEIFFDKTTPKIGEKVTATAMPKFFKNSNEDLYYTWFLFKEGDLSTYGAAAIMENAKRRAMGIVARGDFDPFLFATDYSSGTDEDGYEASFGGGDGVGGKSNTGSTGEYEAENYSDASKQLVNAAAITRCYRHNFGVSSPDDYDDDEDEIKYPGGDLIVQCEHKFAEAEDDSFENPYDSSGSDIVCDASGHEVGDGDFGKDEEACWKLDPNNPDTDGDGINDEADLAGLGQTQLTWTFNSGDRVGVIVEGTSMITTNEGDLDSSALSNTITFTCTNFVDGAYCLDASMQIGQCLSGSCSVISNCTGISDGIPCEISGGGTGTCQTSSCVAVSSCNASSDGYLCESGGIEGTCDDSICYLAQCANEGDTCQTDVGTMGSCDELNICIEDTISLTDPALNPYYKITWAGLDVCDKEEVEGEPKMDLIEDDECDDENSGSGYDDYGDYGFTYLATKAVFEQSEELLKTNLNFTPQAPQFNVENPDYSDYITVKANFSQSEISDDFVYYDWDIYYCEENTLDTCTSIAANRITPDTCSDGDILGNCTSGNIISDSYAEGIGLNQIKFKIADTFLSAQSEDDNFYLKVFLKTKKSKSDDKIGLSSVDIPVVVNDNAIEFFKVFDQGSSYGFDAISDKICAPDTTVTDPLDNPYAQICPVYPGQVIAAKADIDIDLAGSSIVESYSWEVNGQPVVAPGSGSSACDFSTCSLGDTIYLPISGSEMEIQTISLKIKKTGGEEVTSERMLIVAEPMVKIISNDDNAWSEGVEYDDGSGTTSTKYSDTVFLGEIGEVASFKADLVPGYLTDDLTANNISLTWYLNGEEVNSAFASANPDQEILIDQTTGDINFKLTGGEDDTITLVVEAKKEFSTAEQTLLKDNWNIQNLKTLKSKKSITIKQTADVTGAHYPYDNNSIQMFVASTFSNASEYFIFIIRTAIVFVLFWAFTFGFNFWFSRELNIEK